MPQSPLGTGLLKLNPPRRTIIVFGPIGRPFAVFEQAVVAHPCDALSDGVKVDVVAREVVD
jgi:hypothetical protein